MGEYWIKTETYRLASFFFYTFFDYFCSFRHFSPFLDPEIDNDASRSAFDKRSLSLAEYSA